MKTASSTKARLSEKIRDYVSSLKNLRAQSYEFFDSSYKDCQEHLSIYERFSGASLDSLSIFEIGYGAKPMRFLIFNAMGHHVEGIDMDKPIIKLNCGDYIQLLKQNGLERFIKSFGRNIFFDRRHYRILESLLASKGYSISYDISRLYVGDARTFDFNRATQFKPYDLIFSVDVFEHIPKESISTILRNLAAACHSNTILLIRPNIYTGITGGHLKEWYFSKVGDREKKLSEPWEHLRKGRFQANTYLNKLWRKDYRGLFSRDFDILAEIVMHPNLGRDLLTGECAKELSAFPDEELFSNQVIFVLKQKR